MEAGRLLAKYSFVVAGISLGMGILSFLSVAWETEEWKVPEPIRILVVGQDEWPNSPPRADSIHFFSLRISTRSVFLFSIPRDTYTEIPGIGYDRINHSLSKGGISKLIESVEQLLAVRVDHYIVVRYQAFERLIDELGGLNIYVEYPMKCPNPGTKGDTTIAPGTQTLDGEKILCYIRYRNHPKGDIARVNRQQQVLLRLGSKLSQMSFAQLLRIYRSMEPFLETDLTIVDLMIFYRMFAGTTLDAQNVFLLPGTFHPKGYWKPKVQEARKLAQKVFD